ncbi:AcrR family transcriptional regulator [Nocardia transvalensis]|uniref:AcrR family transcriptional regulator n=1 Tax=Nocardia transvalensis TaxID=37333 RepID=A0A7W9PK45_9NOCA|nr:TetR/AcrR family transcriptional regulator [Nocardia transvalensis]MBB5917651.1 AcrR family transcriptional regulator [Nocardia transvalensis]
MTESATPVGLSAKQQLVLTAERLYAVHGIDGVPLRRISAEAGMGNKSAVQYHFGSKQGLIDAILLNRVEELTRRRRLLEARLPEGDLRRVVEAHQLPLMELAEDENCYYLSFLEQLVRDFHPLDKLPATHRDSERAYYTRVGALIAHVPQPLRDIRIHQASAICLHICADRHRMRGAGSTVAPFAVHVSQLLDTLVTQLSTPPSGETLAALANSQVEHPTLSALP